MKNFRYIAVVLLSLLVIYAGVGFSVIHCYCMTCEIESNCCSTEEHEECGLNIGMQSSLEHSCCVATTYKVDLLKRVQSGSNIESFVFLSCQELLRFVVSAKDRPLQIKLYETPPGYILPRQYLTLYSTLII